MKKLLVVDGNSLLNRAFYAIKPLTNSAGLFTHAVYGFTTSLLKHLETLKPDYAVAAFDMPAPTFRHGLYDGYKATRKGMANELAVQLPYAKKVAEALGFTLCGLPGWEADDVLGTLAAESERDPELQTWLATGDRDAMQLITDNVRVLYAKTRETVIYDREKFIADYGVPPEHYVEEKALMGDSSDNIPGVQGIGEKTAAKLIAAYGTLETLYARLPVPEVSASVNAKLEAGRESAFLSRTLAAISREAPLPFALNTIEYGGMKRAALLSLLAELEFTSLIDKLELRRAAEPPSADCQSVECEPDAAAFGEPEELDGAAFAALPEDRIWTVAAKEDLITAVSGCEAYKCAAGQSGAFFASHKISAHDTKALRHALAEEGITELSPAFDTLLAAYVVDPASSRYDPVKLADKYLANQSAGIAGGAMTGGTIDSAVIIDRLRGPLCDALTSSGQDRLFYGLELPLAGGAVPHGARGL